MAAEHNTCGFCLEDVCDPNEAFALPCKHKFHRECLKGLVRSDKYCGKHKCPLCRGEFGGTTARFILHRDAEERQRRIEEENPTDPDWRTRPILVDECVLATNELLRQVDARRAR